jgi:very-short-patch-repair endonuclease
VLENCGFHVLRFWNPHVLTEIDGVLREIHAALESARP